MKRTLKLPQLVRPTKSAADKTGCLNCTLLIHNQNFDEHWSESSTIKDPQKVRDKLPVPHTTTSVNVSEKPWDEVDILFVGEALGAEEDHKGVPFVGKSGQALRTVAADLSKSTGLKYAITNVVRCRPPNNRDPSHREVVACTPELLREIRARKPKIIVPLGNISLEFFSGSRGITFRQGRAMRCNTAGLEHLVIVPCFHPAYCLRNPHEWPKFTYAVELAFDLATKDTTDIGALGEYATIDTLPKLKRVVKEMLYHGGNGKVLAYDTETGSLSPFQTHYPKLLCFSFAWKNKSAIVVPLDHHESPWSLSVPKPRLKDVESLVGAPPLPADPTRPRKVKPAEERRLNALRAFAQWEEDNLSYRRGVLAERRVAWRTHRARAKRERPRVLKLLRKLFKTPALSWVGQNEKFDHKHVMANLGVRIKGKIYDTITTHFTLDDRRGTHGLDVLAHRYTDMGGYDRPLDEYKKKHPECNPGKKDSDGSYANFPGSILFPYAAADADVTLRVFKKLRKESEYTSEKRNFRNLAERFMPALSATLTDMEYAGAQVDPVIVKQLIRDTKKDLLEAHSIIKEYECVRQFEADNIRRLQKSGKQKAAAEFRFNPSSDAQVGKILWEYLKLRPVELTDNGFKVCLMRYAHAIKKDPTKEFKDVVRDCYHKKEWNFFSTKADVLHEYERQGTDFATHLLTFREKTKLLSTYLRPMRDDVLNGRVYGNFNIAGTGCVTGDTLILTEYGEIPIGQLVQSINRGFTPAPAIRVWDGARWRRPVAGFCSGETPTVRVTTESGRSITATRDHPLLSDAGWIEAAKIRRGDRLIVYTGVYTSREVVSDVSYAGVQKTYDLVMEKPDVEDSVSYLRSTLPFARTSYPGPQTDVGRGREAISRCTGSVVRLRRETTSAYVLGREKIEHRILDKARESEAGCEADASYFEAVMEGPGVCRKGRGKPTIGESFKGRNREEASRRNRTDGRPLTAGQNGGSDAEDAVTPGYARKDATSGKQDCEAIKSDVLEKTGERGPCCGPAVRNHKAAVSRSKIPCRGDGGPKSRNIPSAWFENGTHISQRRVLEKTRELGTSEGPCSEVKSERRNVGRSEQVRSGSRVSVPGRTPLHRKRDVVAETFERQLNQSRLPRCREECSGRTVRRVLASDRTRSDPDRRMEIRWNRVLDRVAIEGLEKEPAGYYRSDQTVRLTHAFVTNGFVSHNTGRLSSSGPNLQNVDPAAKSAYVSRFDNGVILTADYSQIELRIGCCLFGEPTMIKAYLQGEDNHRLTAIAIAKLTPAQYDKLPDKAKKDWRGRAKRINFGILYQAGPNALVNTLKKDGIFITIEEAQKLLEDFKRARPGLVAGIEKLKRFAKKHRYVKTFTGFLRRFPELEFDDREIESRALRQAVNAPVQGGAGHMTLMALVLIHRKLRKLKLRTRLTLTVHDSIVADCPLDEVAQVARLMKHIMENIDKLSDKVLPGVDWSWLKVPIVAEFEAGRTWGESVEFDVDKLGKKSGDEPLWTKNEDKGKVYYKYRAPLTISELRKMMDHKYRKRHGRHYEYAGGVAA